ncbi:CLNK protein, partial [Mystacornis crossleyi]|nr:CLNK protein [Mystacornis crossleyi]
RPLKMLPKQYQPIPPEPRVSSQVFHKMNALSQDPTFPISAKVTRYTNNKFLSFLLIVTSLRKKPEVSFQVQQHPPEARMQLFPSAFTFTGSPLSVDNLTVKKPPPPTSYAARKNKSKYLLVEQEMQSLTQPTEKDETFLVRDCSKKSKAEPYVLVVYYGRRVY